MGRNANQCHYDGCDSAAEYEAHVKLWYKSRDGRVVPLEMKGSAHVCGRHRGAYTQSLLTERNKEMITDQLMSNNLPEPDWSSVTIEFHEILRERTCIEIGYVPPRPKILRCERIDDDERCTNPAQWQLVLEVRSIGQAKNAEPSRILTTRCMCNKHKRSIKPSDVTDVRVRSTLTNVLTQMGIAMPDWKSLTLDFIKMKNGQLVDAAEFE